MTGRTTTGTEQTAVRRLEPTDCSVTVDGERIDARQGETVAATLLCAGAWRPLFCGMGACFACLVTIDGVPDRRGCVEITRPGMVIETASDRSRS